MPSSFEPVDARHTPRLRLPAMYTLVRVRPTGYPKFLWTGYIYDISATGMRFELDVVLDPGTDIEVRAMLPGTSQITFDARGKVVRIHDDEPGPCRMGMTFDHFRHHADRRELQNYLEQSQWSQAA
ncbi:MAG: PilZ domain-containing protein [Phycisphaerales bacterium]|nr:PilZ domain-containing protein [Phycisphaerales bacterium]